ncbi:Transposon Ty3-I Gag-Pol polyprotein [Ceratobasidium sp. AG-Ba]|nr:Transposon Ty3-I Gag-Pol polyprotein [Ceratobasidium sp. AG-Ba]
MDPHKVNSVLNWKVPNTKEQLMSFLGAVGYLAPNCHGIRIPMGVLTSRASIHKHWNWDATAQRAFDEVKEIVSKWRDHHRVAIDYSEGAPPINLVTDASLTGASGILSQGEDPRTAKIAMFWSGKFTPTQQNYPVHELELYAIKESLEKFRYQLHGVKFRIYTDNKSLEHLMTQKSLSPRQARWLEVINEFDFTITHIPGKENKVADALSRMYSDEPEGMVRAESEYLPEDDETEGQMQVSSLDLDGRAPLTSPLYVGNAAISPVPEEGIEASEGATKQGSDRVEPQLSQREPRRSTRERRPVIKYAQPAKKPRQRRKPEPTNNQEQALGAENEPVGNEPAHTVEVPSEMSNQNIPGIAHTPHPNTCIYYDASPTLLDRLRERYSKDNLLSKVIANPSHYRNFDIENGIIYIKQKTGRAVCVPDVVINGRRAREIVIRETHELLKHAGTRKTLYALRGRIWWDTMVPDVKEYCRSCTICATAKSTTQSKLGLLMPLKRPETPWERISIDFVGPLPESENLLGKWDMILVAVDYATGMVRIIPSKQTYRAKEVAELMYEYIYKIHGVPKVIVSDRDSLFTLIFWNETNRLMGIQTRMSSAYHPETNGATERANKTIGSMIRQCIKGRQSSWVRYLPGIEYAINASVSDTTGYSPFYLNYGRNPPPTFWETDSEYSGVRTYLIRQREALMRAHDAMIAARVRQTEQANKHRKAAEFKVGDLVYLSSKNMRLPAKFSRKLTPKYIGPHRIIQEVTEGTTYKIELPTELKARGIHPVFHVSLLRIHVPNNDQKFPGRSGEQIVSLEKEPKEWAVDRIVTHAGKGRDAEFKLLWKSGDYSWESYERIRHLEAMNAYLKAQGVDEASQLTWTDPMEGPESDEGEEYDGKIDEGSVEVNSTKIDELGPHICYPGDALGVYKAREKFSEDLSLGLAACSASALANSSIISRSIYSMYNFAQRQLSQLTSAQLNECMRYRDALSDYRVGLRAHPGVEPRHYQLYRALMMAGSLPERTSGDTPSFPPSPARFAASEDGHIIEIASQAIEALRVTQNELQNALRGVTANATGPPKAPRSSRPTIEVEYPSIPEGFTGQIGTTLSSRIGAHAAPKPKRIGWITDPDTNARTLVYGNKAKRFAPYKRGKPPARGGKSQGRWSKRDSGAPALQNEHADSYSKKSDGHSPIEIDELESSTGRSGSGSRESDREDAPATVPEPPVLDEDMEDDGWLIRDYDEEEY